MVTKSELKQILENDKQTSIGLGVPLHLFSTATEFIDWRGRFHAVINDNRFEMVVTPSTLFLNDPDPKAPILNMMGNSWVDTAMGQLTTRAISLAKLTVDFSCSEKQAEVRFLVLRKNRILICLFTRTETMRKPMSLSRSHFRINN